MFGDMTRIVHSLRGGSNQKYPAGPNHKHQAWVRGFTKTKDPTIQEQYREMYRKASHTDVTHKFREKEAGVPWDLSRRAFRNLSTSAEAFYLLRERCLRSHSVLCVCQYLLGIGDRHLSNTMVDLTSGRMIGIDFGHAFGSATQFLPVPELMPFRLTRQITNLGLPLKEKGLIHATMTHVLRALRSDCDLLLTMMDIFIKEPSVDWMAFAARQKREGMGTTDADIDESWYPKQKIQYAQRKLKGDKPAHITSNELKLGHPKSTALKDMQSVVMGDGATVRGTLPNTGLTVEQQVDALIDQATDANILGRVYGGWEPWM